jgi:hypothetical protein
MAIQSFADYCRKRQLTEEQRELTHRLDRFLSGNHPVFILKGSAGTGKTYMIRYLTEYLRARGRAVALAAPTGRAAMIIAQRTKVPAQTVHRLIYSHQSLIETGNANFKVSFKLAENNSPGDTVYIIDEASMLSNVQSENEWLSFGSGNLLRDFFGYSGLTLPGSRCKVIFIGDNAQLPPVHLDISPALNGPLLKREFGTNWDEFCLTEVVRQQAGSGILANAQMLRQALRELDSWELDFQTDWEDIRNIGQDAFRADYLTVCPEPVRAEAVVVVQTNDQARNYNRMIRDYYGFPAGQIALSDRVIVVTNNYNYDSEIYNGQFGRISALEPTAESINIPFKTKNGTINQILKFRNVTIDFGEPGETAVLVQCKIIENLLDSSEVGLTAAERQALYVYFKIRHRDLRAGTGEFNEALRCDPYFNALQVKYGYAVTCHKAQGGEWPQVFLDCAYTARSRRAQYLRWLYTGVTRAQKRLYLIAPHYTRMVTASDTGRARDILRRQKGDATEDEILPEGMENEFQRELYRVVRFKLQDERIAIVQVQHFQYCEQYHLAAGAGRLLVKIHYRKKGSISKVELPFFANDTGLVKRIGELLRDLEGKALEGDTAKKTAAEWRFPADQPHRAAIYRTITAKIAGSNLRIGGIKPLDYRERYTFVAGCLIGVVDVIYNRYGRITRLEAHQSSNSMEFAGEIIARIILQIDCN